MIGTGRRCRKDKAMASEGRQSIVRDPSGPERTISALNEVPLTSVMCTTSRVRERLEHLSEQLVGKRPRGLYPPCRVADARCPRLPRPGS